MTVVVFSSCLKLSLLELFMSILSPMSHSFFLILLSSYLFVLSFVDLGTLFGPSTPFIISSLQKISRQLIPEGLDPKLEHEPNSTLTPELLIYYIGEL